MKKRSKVIALALTFVMAVGFTVGTFAYNKAISAVAVPANHYFDPTEDDCLPCIENPPGTGLECTTTESLERCTCITEMAVENATSDDAICRPLYKNTINP